MFFVVLENKKNNYKILDKELISSIYEELFVVIRKYFNRKLEKYMLSSPKKELQG